MAASSGPNDNIIVPTAVSLPATQQIERPPIEYVERLFTNIKRWDELGKSGHFAALEDPQLVAGKIHDFFQEL